MTKHDWQPSTQADGVWVCKQCDAATNNPEGGHGRCQIPIEHEVADRHGVGPSQVVPIGRRNPKTGQPVILAFDLSLTSTGVCRDGKTSLLKWKSVGTKRLAAAYNDIKLMASYAEIVVIEGYSFDSRSTRHHAIGELGGVARLAILHAGVVEPFVIAPTSIKKYATGKGNASKAQVVSAAVLRAKRAFATDDEADAWWMWAFVRALTGKPVVKLPQTHRVALEVYRPDEP